MAVLHENKSNAAGNNKRLYTPVLKGNAWAHDNYQLNDAITKKQEQPMHPPKVLQKPNIVLLPN